MKNEYIQKTVGEAVTVHDIRYRQMIEFFWSELHNINLKDRMELHLTLRIKQFNCGKSHIRVISPNYYVN